jgi:hypothetical protein
MTRNKWILMIVLSFFMGWGISRWMPAPLEGMAVTFSNTGEIQMQSIQLEFGNADSQSNLLALRVEPGQTRTLLLNHQPGLGFNVRIQYADGSTQEFCALRGDDRTHPTIALGKS